jgi:hypothetical protein
LLDSRRADDCKNSTLEDRKEFVRGKTVKEYEDMLRLWHRKGFGKQHSRTRFQHWMWKRTGRSPQCRLFNVGSDPLLRALNLISLAYRYRHSNGLKVPTTGYADDLLHPMKVENAQQVLEILTVYTNF